MEILTDDVVEKLLDNGDSLSLKLLTDHMRITDSIIRSYKYTHPDLTKDELGLVFKEFGLELDTIIMGSDACRVIDGVLKCYKKLDGIKLLQFINSIK